MLNKSIHNTDQFKKHLEIVNMNLKMEANHGDNRDDEEEDDMFSEIEKLIKENE